MPAPRPWLVAGHRYLFKKSRPVYPEQFWAEIVASRLSSLTGVAVPPAYAAWDSRNNECAALIEWFWGYPGGPVQHFLSGGLFMKAMIQDFDHKKGTQHNFSHIQGLCRVFAQTPKSRENEVLLAENWLATWARMLTFDALIGNTDRHQENWGFIGTKGQSGAPLRFELSPAFDNGTSLGHERPPAHFARFQQPAYCRLYIRKGRHHLRWQIGDAKSCGHVELLLKILEQAPECRPAMLAVLKFDHAALDQAITPLCDLAVPLPLSRERAQFILTLLKARQCNLLESLEAR